jgi:hypothetical protein
MAFLITSAVIGGASALYGIGKGISQNAKANGIDANNRRPTYTIPQEYQDNVNLARQMAQVGLPQQQYNNQQNNILSNQSSGLQALGRSANVGSGVASVVRASNDASNNLNAQDAAARQNNQRFFIGQNGVLGQQKLAQQQYNQFDKYTEQFNKSAALRGAANQNIQNGVNGAAGMAAGLYGMGQNKADTPAVDQLGSRQTLQNTLPIGLQTPYSKPMTPYPQQQVDSDPYAYVRAGQQRANPASRFNYFGQN